MDKCLHLKIFCLAVLEEPALKLHRVLLDSHAPVENRVSTLHIKAFEGMQKYVNSDDSQLP